MSFGIGIALVGRRDVSNVQLRRDRREHRFPFQSQSAVLPQLALTAETNGTGTTYKTGSLHFQLQNCGANIPNTSGGHFIVQDSFDIRPASLNGPISGPVIGNDQILCSNVASGRLRAPWVTFWVSFKVISGCIQYDSETLTACQMLEYTQEEISPMLC